MINVSFLIINSDESNKNGSKTVSTKVSVESNEGKRDISNGYNVIAMRGQSSFLDV